MKLKLEPVYCPKCGKLLVWTLSKAKVFCPHCKVWSKPQPQPQSHDKVNKLNILRMKANKG